jgi:hypothetical protein
MIDIIIDDKRRLVITIHIVIKLTSILSRLRVMSLSSGFNCFVESLTAGTSFSVTI